MSDLVEPSRNALARFVASLPRGRKLSPEEFRPRHRGILVVAYAQAVGLAIFGAMRGYGVLHSMLEAGFVVCLALAASVPLASQRVRSTLACLSLVTASAIAVHFSGGYIEAHFHFFVMLAIVALYQDYVPFLAAIGFVAVDHGLIGAISPGSVYNHAAGYTNPWGWALIHASLVLGESAALLVGWKVIEDADARTAKAELRAIEERGRMDKLATLGSVSAGVAHEVNNPLAAMRANAQLFLMDAEAKLADPHSSASEKAFAQDAIHTLKVNIDGAARIAKIVDALGALAKPKSGTQEVALRPLVEATMALAGTRLRGGSHVESSVPEDLRAVADADGLGQVFLNLMLNAADAVPQGTGVVRVTGEARGDRIRIVVEDNGPGVAPEMRAKLFTPFLTTKKHGTGLGLSLSQRIVEESGGSLRYEERPGGGARFVIELLPPGALPQTPRLAPLSHSHAHAAARST